MRALSLLRAVIPRRVVSAVRLLDVFQNQLGHSCTRNGLIVDGSGEPIPWLTYPAVEYLKGLDFTGLDIFEYGSGASTLFWASRAATVTAVEHDRGWHDRMASRLPGNSRLILETDGGAYPRAIGTGTFDVIVIDGAERRRCAEHAVRALRAGGMIVLDNADWYPKTSAFLASSYIEARFSGFSPLNAFTSTTAVFFDRAFRIPTLADRALPAGGRRIAVLDDEPVC